MSDQLPSTFNAPLSEVDPEIAAVLEQELGRQRDYLEMIASENFVPRAVLAVAGQRAHQQVRRGLPRPPLLRRLRVRRRRRAARDRPREEPVRRRVRQRAAALRRHGQRRRALGDRHPRRHHPRSRARPRRPPHPRHEAQLLGQALQRRLLRRRPRDLPRRHGRRARQGARAQAAGHHRRLVGLPAPARLRRVPRDRRRGRREALGRHGALRRPRRRRPAPVARAVRRRRVARPCTRPSAARAPASS